MEATLIGKFIDTAGLSYRCGALEGRTGLDGSFHYTPGENVTFSFGSLKLGSAKGKPLLTVLDVVDNPSLTNVKLVNIARLLFSFAPGLGFEKPIQIDERARNLVSKYAREISVHIDDTTALDAVLQKIGVELGISIKTIPHIRNHLRRALSGFRVLRDMKIPVRDGEYVLGDIYLPFKGDRFPVLMSSTVYGKRIVYSGPKLDDLDEIAGFEKAEEIFFTTSDNSPIPIPNTDGLFANWSKQRIFETISTFNTFFWVPRGYAMVKIDPRGVGQTPGKRGILVSDQELNDLCDAVEWIARQSWCTGKVALTGNSYGGNWQWQVAVHKPRGLKALVPFGSETNFYHDLSHIGGVPTYNFFEKWKVGIQAASPRWTDEIDLVKTFSRHPFYDDYWERYDINLESIDIPVFIGAAQMLVFHNRAPYEAWRRVSTRHKALEIVDTNYYSWPNRETAHKLLLFADRHLKGIDQSEDLEPVGMQMRIGHGDWYWRTEADWPVPETHYVEWYLHADGTLSEERPASTEVQILSYSAEIEPKSSKAGITFVSNKLKTDVELAGHFTATLNVSSTSHDADVVVSLWALDENDDVVRFCVGPNPEPFASGLLRASHRKTDPNKSLPWRPWHTHKEEDYAPLKSDEVVEINVEICPSTSRLRAGWRLRVDILPTEAQREIPGYQSSANQFRSWVEDYHDGAMNSLHLGGQRLNFVRLPVVPLKSIGPLNVVP